MKLVCSQKNLSENLSLVSRAVSSRPSHPVLANVLLVADEETQRVRLSAFDLSLGIQTSFPAEVDTGGKLTLPARLLNDIVSRLPEGDIELDSPDPEEETETSLVTNLISASGRYQVRGMGADEFPELPAISGVEMHLPAVALLEGLRGALFAASADETKQVLTGVHLTIAATGLEFAATDGHRLAVVEAADEAEASQSASDETLDVTIPAKALNELIRLLERHDDDAVAVKFDPSQVVFEWTEQRLTSRLLEGQYPNYRQLIPRQFSHQMTVERRLLLGALERIAILADQKNNIVKMTLDQAKQEVSLSVDAPDVGSGCETIPAQISGDDMDIAFNAKYLLEGLKALPSTEIQMQFNTPTSPAIATPLGSIKMTYLVMPVQIRS